MKDTQNSPLHHDPIFDQDGLLSDVPQLRELVVNLVELLKTAGTNPRLFTSPVVQNVLGPVLYAIHESACTDCTETKRTEGLSLLNPTIASAVKLAFEGFIAGEEAKNHVQDELTVDRLLASLHPAGTSNPLMN